MFDRNDLKPQLRTTELTVECPIKGCEHMAPRQRRHFPRLPAVKCPTHRIYISPSTFEYEDEGDNFLWRTKADLDLWKRIKEVKRESRVAHDNSEDAVSWNVISFLQQSNLLLPYLRTIHAPSTVVEDLIYWSYSCKDQRAWPSLDEARVQFGERTHRGSEPEIIVVTDKAVMLFEPKLGSCNNTRRPSKRKKYETGGNGWFARVFRCDYDTNAIRVKTFQLMRFWLLGTWIAERLGRDFLLINLVPKDRLLTIEADFQPLIRESKRRLFRRATWESIHDFLIGHRNVSGCETVISYFRNKTLGYSGGRLKAAFNV